MYASFESFMRTILIILAVYFLLRFLWRFFGPKLFQYFIKKITQKAASKFEAAQQNYQSQTRPEQPPVSRKSSATFKTDKDFGEYIDYEEID